MKEKIYLQIAEPCHENWDIMSPVQQGRYCNSCCKQVVDFTQKSDKQILQILTKAAGNTCGRFNNDQLGRPLLQNIPYSLRPYKFFLSAFIPALVITGSALSQDQLQGKVAVKTSQHFSDTLKGDTVYTQRTNNRFKGSISLEGNGPASGVSVTIKGTNKRTLTDDKGSFHFGDIAGDGKIILEISHMGYTTKNVTVNLKNQKTIAIKLAVSEVQLMGEVVVFARCTSKKVKVEETAVEKKAANDACIQGQVVDAAGKPMPYANITVEGDKRGATADSLGNFKLHTESKDKFVDLVASYAGYEQVTKRVSYKNDDSSKIILTLSENRKLPDALVTAYSTSYMQTTVGGVSLVKSVTLADTAKAMTAKVFRNEMFKVFPNPAVRGSEAHITFKQAGTYTIHLFDNAGKLHQSQNIVVTYEKKPSIVRLPATLIPGQYFIKAVNQQTKKQFADKIIIQ
jgi:hypothetical protein